MQTLKHCSLLLFIPVLIGCNVSPKPIIYGVDACHYCAMTIVDKFHAAEIVTKKGKIYTFDATECMVNFLNDFDTSRVNLFLTTNYSNPEEFIDATTATFLISKNIPSPMGGFISGFKTKNDAINAQSKNGGDLYNWNELIEYLKNSNK